MRIVHVADLHIADPSAALEHLREGHFREYLRLAGREILGPDKRAADALIITGDLVHQGNAANFPHAIEVIKYLKEQLGVPDGMVYLCPGNHDILRDKEFEGLSYEARGPFREAAALLNSPPAVGKIGERASLLKLRDGVWVITIDTTLFSDVHPVQELIAKGTDPADALANWVECPGITSTADLDAIVAWFDRGPIARSDLVLIAAHYPVDYFIAQTALYTDDSTWTQKHVWPPGQIITRRVENIGREAPLIWLGGDVHQGSQNADGNTIFLVTGRLGTKVEKESGAVMREIRLIEIDETQAVRTKVLEYRTGWGEHAIIGEWRWKPLPEEPIYHRQAPASESQTTRSEESIYPPELADPESQISAKPEEIRDPAETATRSKLNELDSTLGEILLLRIDHEQLYHLGRFETASEYTALGWVSIGPLVTGHAVLRTTLHAMARRIRAWEDESAIAVDKCVLIGIDCWGAGLAAQLSLLSGIEVSILAARGHRTSSDTMGELLPVDAIAPHVETAILITDAVATGGTLLYVRNEIERILSRKLKWYALSLIADPLQYPYEQLAFLDEHATACSKLRLPVVSTDFLPDRTILPPLIRFNEP